MMNDYINPEELLDDGDEFDIEEAQLEELEELEELEAKNTEQQPASFSKNAKEATCGDIENEYFSMLKKSVPQDQVLLVLARKYGYTPYEIEMIVL